jgi:hypothetical protein
VVRLVKAGNIPFKTVSEKDHCGRN